MNRWQAIIADRTESRRQLAEAVSRRVVAALNARAIAIRVFGSLARGDFRDHSDVDFLVSGPVDSDIRMAVETAVAQEIGDADLPYDIIYLDDLTPEQAAVFSLG